MLGGRAGRLALGVGEVFLGLGVMGEAIIQSSALEICDSFAVLGQGTMSFVDFAHDMLFHEQIVVVTLVDFYPLVRVEQVEHHFAETFGHKRHGPLKSIHEVR